MRDALAMLVAITCTTGCTKSEQAAESSAAPNVSSVRVAAPALAPTTMHVDTLHGVEIRDPYRWLEDTTASSVRSWMTAQRAYTDSVLANVIGRDSLLQLVEQANKAVPALDIVREVGTRTFVTRWLGASPSLFAIDSAGARERLLLDATAFGAEKKGRGMRAFVPSYDARSVVVGSTDEGDEGAALTVRDVATGATRERIPDLLTTTSGTRYEVTWLPDGRGFFYPRLYPGATQGPPAERLSRGRQFLHLLGTPQSADVAVFGYGVSANVALDPVDLPTRVLTGANSRWLVGSIFRSKRSGTDFYLAPLPTDPRSVPAWRPLASVDDRIAAMQLRGDTLYALSRQSADRGAIVRTVLGGSDTGSTRWTTVVPERRGVITAYTVQRDGLYFTEREGGAITLRRVARGSADPSVVSLPQVGTVRLQAGAPNTDGVLVSVESWAIPPSWYRVAADGKAVETLAIDPGMGATPATGMMSARLEAPSRDGVMVPVSIAYGSAALRNGVLDGSAPLLIEAYGGFGSSTDPFFFPTVQAWLAMGGVYAWAHVRGGGELGDAWHRAATRENKQRSIDDMIGAIDALIAARYTSARRVVVTGTSFGATIPGHVMLQRPELLGLAIYEVGQPDEIRGAALDPTAARNIADVGDMDSAEGVRSLLKASPYHAVPSQLRLPAVIVHSASDDYNFGTQMLPAKFVARLQAANRGARPVLWWQTGGGHRNILNLDPMTAATAFAFMLWQTGDVRYQPSTPAKK